MMTCLEFAAKLRATALLARAEIDAPTEALMAVVEAQAREAIGTFKYGWPALAESTQADRVRQGYPADEPLLRTGAMAESLKHTAQLSAEGAEGIVYSYDIRVAWQELGTKRGIPPRSFVFQSMIRASGDMNRIFAEFFEAIFERGRFL